MVSRISLAFKFGCERVTSASGRGCAQRLHLVARGLCLRQVMIDGVATGDNNTELLCMFAVWLCLSTQLKVLVPVMKADLVATSG